MNELIIVGGCGIDVADVSACEPNGTTSDSCVVYLKNGNSWLLRCGASEAISAINAERKSLFERQMAMTEQMMAKHMSTKTLLAGGAADGS